MLLFFAIVLFVLGFVLGVLIVFANGMADVPNPNNQVSLWYVFWLWGPAILLLVIRYFIGPVALTL